MIAVDTNILLYAHRPEYAFQESAQGVVRSLAEGDEPWCIPWPVVHEFLATVTHRRNFIEPSDVQDAFNQIVFWAESPSVRFIGEPDDYLLTLQKVIGTSQVIGGKIHDARIVAICLSHEVNEIFTADRDFSRFSKMITVTNPIE